MIVKFSVSNFYSFSEEATISFEVGKKPSSSNFDIIISPDRRLNKVAAVIGPNASGKTQLVKPLAFLSWFINDSFLGKKPNSDIPFQPHALFKNKDTKFELFFILDDTEYCYQLDLNSQQVKREALFKKTTHLFSYIFVRELQEINGKSHYSYKQKGFGFMPSKAEKIRGNVSIISAAFNYDVEKASLFALYFAQYFYNINVSGRHHFDYGDLFESAEFFDKNSKVHARMESMLCGFDMGLCSVKLKKVELTDPEGETSNSLMPFGVHKYKGKSFELPFLEESSGTQSAFVLLRRILPVLEQGGVAIIDEIDNDLHPHMLPHILELFKFKHSNPKNAQIIFTCHTPEVLNILKKHQVFLVEKEGQSSDSWRLDEMVGLRADNNLYAKYMAGALSAVPNL